MKRTTIAVAFFLSCVSFAQAGIIRHVVKPTAKVGAKVVVKTSKTAGKVAQKVAHGTKTVVY